MKQIIIYGIGKMAEFIFYSFQNDSEYEVIAFCVDDEYLATSQKTVFNLPVLSFKDILLNYPPQNFLIHIAIGRNDAREAIFTKVSDSGYDFASYLCSKASVWSDLEIGRNVFIDQASVIQPYSIIGDNCILIGAKIGHHSSIGNNSLISCATLAGNVSIGANTFLGLNSAIKENVKIGTHNIIGAGCFISKNTENGTLIYQDRAAQKIVLSKNIVLFK